MHISARIPHLIALAVAFVVVAACGDNTHVDVDTAPPSTAKQLTTFSFKAANNPGLVSDVDATIAGAQVSATLPFGTDMSGLVATFTTTGETITVDDKPQVSGVTSNSFANAITYVVVAADGSSKSYMATMAMANSSAKSISAYSFLAANNDALASDVAATINGSQISAIVPFGTDPSALIASFTTSGQSVAVGSGAQTSGVSADDFTSPVAYTVTAADGTTSSYTATVTVALNPAKDITAFAFTSALNSGLANDVVATISGTAITATVPYGTDVSALVATFSTSGQRVAVGAVDQQSGVSADDFSSDVYYVVTAADGTTKTYDVAISIALNPAKDITAFSITSALNSDAGVTSDEAGSIDGKTVTVHVPYGTTLTSLIATFSITGASVAVNGNVQTSGVTANDFTSAVTYTVTAADGTTKDYSVTATPAPLMDSAPTIEEAVDGRCDGAISLHLGVATATTVIEFQASVIPYAGDTNVKLAIWNDTTETLVYVSDPIAVTEAAGTQWAASPTVSVSLVAGDAYQFAALVQGCAYFPWGFGSFTTNGLTAESSNGNPTGYDTPTFTEDFAGVNPEFQIWGSQP